MASQATSIAKRLCAAGSPRSLPDWKKKDGYYIETCRLSREDVPGLIDIASKWSDPDWGSNDFGVGDAFDHTELLPVVAWRALADLKASEAVEPLIDMLRELDDELDDWVSEELPHVFGMIGQPAVDALVQLANDADTQSYIRSTAASSLRRVADCHAETRDHVVARLAEMMSKDAPCDIDFNSTLLLALVELRYVEAAETIERAFANDCLDVGMMGDWEDVRRELGVEGLRLEMPKHPHNCIEQFRRRIGIGIFSDKRIFADGEAKPEAEQAYYEKAFDLFSKSQEAEAVVEQFGSLGWLQSLLSFGLDYRGEIVDGFTVASVEEFVFEYVPRKVSADPERAASIVFELTMFWEYLDRVFELPATKSIVEWLKTDGIAARLEAEMSDPANFGMAKSMFMSGINAGYDLTSEAGIAEFIGAYNQSLRPEAVAEPVPEPEPILSRNQRVGRNDPCPCGSGKKFKKCCR